MTSFHDAPLTNNYKQFMCRAELMIEMVTGLRYENAPTTSGRTVHETGLPVYHENYQIRAPGCKNWISLALRLACCLSKGSIRFEGI